MANLSAHKQSLGALLSRSDGKDRQLMLAIQCSQLTSCPVRRRSDAGRAVGAGMDQPASAGQPHETLAAIRKVLQSTALHEKSTAGFGQRRCFTQLVARSTYIRLECCCVLLRTYDHTPSSTTL